jgi:hypothetical protein
MVWVWLVSEPNVDCYISAYSSELPPAKFHNMFISNRLCLKLVPFVPDTFCPDAMGKKWVPFSIWDSAGNVAFAQPLRLP